MSGGDLRDKSESQSGGESQKRSWKDELDGTSCDLDARPLRHGLEYVGGCEVVGFGGRGSMRAVAQDGWWRMAVLWDGGCWLEGVGWRMLEGGCWTEDATVPHCSDDRGLCASRSTRSPSMYCA